MDTITIAQAIVGIAILRNEAQERIFSYRGCTAEAEARFERDAYQTVLNILSNIK